MEEIEKLLNEMSELDNQWKSALQSSLEGFKDKYGLFIPNNSIQTLGLDKYHEIYQEKKRQLENKIINEYIKSLSSIANSIAKENIKPPLIDYNIPFKFIEDSENKTIYPTKDEKIIFYFLTKPVKTFRELQSIILSEPGYFNQADVIIEKGKAPYQTTIKNTKANLQYYNMFDKKGNITIVGKGVKDVFNKLLAEDKTMLNSIDEKFALDQLVSLISEFIDSKNSEEWLITLDGKSNLESNLKLIRDTFKKLESN